MYRKTVLDNGLSIVSEEISYVRSISIGIWVKCGSRDEDPSSNGTAHFIEHMLFKGTEKRSAFDIAYEIDSIGGLINAYTGKEATTFYMKVPDYFLAKSIDILADIFRHSLFDPVEIEKEKDVVLQEIHMVEDTPDEYIFDFFGGIFWNGHPLGFPVLGTKGSVGKFNRQALVSFFNANYSPENLVITATGNLRHEELLRFVQDAFGDLRPGRREPSSFVPTVVPRIGVIAKDLEQVHAVLGTLGPSFTAAERYAGFLLNAVLGGSMSSRLFQEIREKRGLAYSIHSYLVSYRDAGKLGIYVGTSEDKFRHVIDLILAELDRFKTDSLTQKELHSAKEQIKGNFLLGMESTDNRMTRLAKNEIYFERQVTTEETLERIDAVQAEEILALAGKLFNPERLSIAAIGKVREEDIRR